MKNKKRKLSVTMLSAAAFLSLSLAVSAVGFSAPYSAGALNSTTGAVSAGGGAELWDADAGEFNSEVMDDLVDKLFGDEDPVEYIKTMKDAQTDSYVVPASAINKKVGTNNGLVVKLDGKEWMAASLTLADIEGEEDNVILTLYLANDLGTSQYYTSNTDTRGNNIYSRSTIRNHLLTHANWSLFNTTEEDGFASQFLVQPKYINYQHNETQRGRTTPIGGEYHLPNDALDTQTGGWHTKHGSGYKSDEVIGGVRYDAWGEDYIWLPSATETGMTNYINGESSIWKLSTEQLQHNAQTYSWLRSGYYNYFNRAYLLQTSGAYDGSTVTSTYGVRPALHFNLSSAALGAAGTTLLDPENVTTTYNGDVQTLKSAYDANPKSASWYKAKWYEHTSNYIKITTSAEMKNAGEYWVSVELQQNWFDDTNKLVEQQGAEQGWTTDEIAAAKERRKPKFKGDPDTSDSSHAETDRIRWFKFIINPKEITVTKPSYNASTGVFVAPKFVDESEICGEKPVLATKFTGTAASGAVINQIDEIPNKRGTYTAQAVFVKSESDKTEYNGNYKIKDAANMTCTVQINRGRVSIPAAADAQKPYTGSEIEFALSGYSADWPDLATLTLPAGMTLKGSDAEGWKLSVKAAGSYQVTATLKNTTEYCWDSGNFAEEIIADRTFTVTVTRKTLLVDFTSTAAGGGFLLQAGANVSFGAEPSNAFSGDTVTLSLAYYNAETPETKINVPNGTLDASLLNPGTYYLVATLDDAKAADNKSYTLDGGEAKQEFTVSAKNIVIDSVNWQYSQNNGAPTPIAGGAGGSASSPFTVTYNGSAFVFALNTSGLEEAGVKIDAKYGTNGYTNGTQTNATDGAVAVTVRLVPFEEGFAFNDEFGKPLPQQYKEFTIYVKVDKANVDFSQVEWSASELEFNAVNQQVTVKSGFPSFLIPVYIHASPSTNVGTYTTRVSGVTVSNQTVAANYNIPTSTQILNTPELKHEWEIVKKRIVVTWQNVEQSDDGGTVIFVPCVSDNSAGAIVYTYYNAAQDTEMTLDEIFAECSQTQTQTYWVCAKLKPAGASGTAYNETNCVLIEGGQDVSGTGSFQSFTTGDNKTPVRVGLVKDKTVYNKQPQPAEIDFQGGNLTLDDFTVTYTMKDGSPVNGIPTNAGEYKVIIALDNKRTDEYAISGQCEFDYVIEKASYDVSSLKWVDTENGNAEYTEAYVYAYGVSHTLELVGDEIDGLTINYTAETEDNRIGANAGSYNVVVTFEVRDELNYNVPDDLDFTWVITPYTPDLSGVTWNYNTDSPFTFKIIDGVAVKYSAFLSGLPEGIEELIEYSGDTAEYSNAGSHVTSFAIKEDHPNRGNWGELVFGSGLESRLVWEIKTKLVDRAEPKQTQTFRDEGFDFSEITLLPDDFAQYFDIKVLDDDTEEEIQPTDGTWKFLNMGRYKIQIAFKPGMNKNNGGEADNVKWSNNTRGSYLIIFQIDCLVLDINGWIDAEENGRPELDADEIDLIEKYFDYVIVKTETGEELPVNTILEYDTIYTIALRVKEEYRGNVQVRYDGVTAPDTAPYGFKTDTDPLASPPENFFRKPTDEELTLTYQYTGKEIIFELGDWFVSEKMQVLGGELKGTEVGTYHIRVGFKRGAASAWEPEDAPKPDTSPVTVTVTITPRPENAGQFQLTDSAQANHPYKFQYGDFTEETNIGEYVYDAQKPLFITRLALGDTLADLLAQFANAQDITAYDANGNPITDLSTALATGMSLRLMNGTELVNMLTLSVLGDVNGDGKITGLDKAQLNAHTLGTNLLTNERLLSGDINDDGKITGLDKSQLNAYTLGSRDIYEGLSIKQPAAKQVAPQRYAVQAVSAVTEPEPERTEELPEPESETVQTEPERAERTEENVETANRSEISVPFADEKRYAICDRKERIA